MPIGYHRYHGYQGYEGYHDYQGYLGYQGYQGVNRLISEIDYYSYPCDSVPSIAGWGSGVGLGEVFDANGWPLQFVL